MASYDDDRPRRKKSGGKKRRKKSSNNNTVLIIILAVVGGMLFLCVGGFVIMGVVMAPAVKQARTAARTTQTKSHLKQVGLAAHNFHDAHQTFPPNGIVEEGQVPHSWATHMLPYLDQSPLYRMIDLTQPYDAPSNGGAFSNPVITFTNVNEADITPVNGYAVTHFAANSNTFPQGEGLKIRDFQDGTSNTMLIGTVANSFRPWGDPHNNRDPANGIGPGANQFGQSSGEGPIVLLADGSVHILSKDIDPSIMQAFATPAGGEPVGDF